ncbi:MAG TPA: hypothetical protein DCZ12_05190 [Gammaproteobacteria bacterium]|nr:hypothetical protein [Gammaproteobacteria bacterium]HCO61334.1 hypothetical protein [Porticoccaceae bacterium]
MNYRNVSAAIALSVLCWLNLSTASASEIIFGVKAGGVDFDADGIDPTTIVSGQLGYEFLDLIAADIATELEITRSISDGESDSGDYSYASQALYLSARSIGPIYVIGRAGVIAAEVDYNSGGSVDDTGVAYGVGVGFSTGIRFELELTRYEFEDTDTTTLTLGVHF